MSLELSGTTPAIKGVAGSVSAPAITGDDADTGISFPAADTIKFSAGGVEKLAITASGLSGDGSGLTNVGGGKLVQVKSVSKLDTFSVTSPTANQYYDVTGLDNLQITTTGSNKVIVFMTVHISMPASGYRVWMKGVRITGGVYHNLSYPSSSSNNIEASSTVVSASNTPHGRVPYPLHIVGFEDSPGAGTHQYGIQIGTANTTTIHTGRPYAGTNSTSYGTSPSGTITLYEVEP